MGFRSRLSNRTTDHIYKRHRDDRQVLSNHKRESVRRIVGSVGQKSNGFRLSDIAKLIAGRHGGPCDDPKRMRKYFYAALPHILSDAGRIVRAGGCYVEAMKEWVTEHIPMLRITLGDEWIAGRVSHLRSKPQRRRCPRVDVTARLMDVEDHEPETFDLCSIPAMSRPRKIRETENKARRAVAEQGRRAQVEGYTPRSESKAEQIRSAGGNVNTEKSRARRARLKAQASTTETGMHPVSCPDLDDVHPVPCPTWVEPPCTLFRAPHHSNPRAGKADPSDDLVLLATEAETNAAERAAYLDATRASTVYGSQPLPDDEQHDRNMRSLVDGWEITMAAYLDCDPAWQIAFREDDREQAHHRRAA